MKSRKKSKQIDISKKFNKKLARLNYLVDELCLSMINSDDISGQNTINKIKRNGLKLNSRNITKIYYYTVPLFHATKQQLKILYILFNSNILGPDVLSRNDDQINTLRNGALLSHENTINGYKMLALSKVSGHRQGPRPAASRLFDQQRQPANVKIGEYIGLGLGLGLDL